ncbi:MAG: hypothetical protein ABI571_02720 [Actinomycetota bacterium]
MRPKDKALEADDPFEFVGATYPVEDGEAADREMTRCFVEEYALMGWSAERIRGLFRSPFYAGTHAVLVRRGDGFVDSVITEIFGEEG